MLSQTRHLGILFTVCLIFNVISKAESVASTATRQNWLNSLSEYYLFKPVLSSVKTLSSSFSTSSRLKNSGIFEKEISILIKANNTIYNIFLQINDDFIPRRFTASHLGVDKKGEDIVKSYSSKDLKKCYYHGHVVGIEDSQVVASTCNGLRGTIFLPNEILQFSPVHGSNINDMHVLFRPQDMPNHSCGTKAFESFHHTMTANGGMDSSPIRLKRATDEKKFIELLVVADKKEFELHGKNRTRLHEHIQEVVNYVDALYKKINLRVVLYHIEVWEKEDKIDSETDAQKVLNSFLAYRMTRVQTLSSDSPWSYTDNAQLFYGGSFEGSTVGMATVSSMCGLRSGGVNEDRGNALHTATTVAHEMGHNLGMSHDTSDCKCDAKKCVMAATSSSTAPGAWSSCSVDYLNKGYETGTGICLSNVPDSRRLFGGPRCGNGIVEEGEKCDCGLPNECQSKCCNATTCQLRPEAECDAGACCTSDCHYKASCSECRPSANDCDITEYCSGFSAHCPSNIHKIDGMDCMSGKGVCYSGVCKTHEMQCQEIWGSDAKNGVDHCYRTINSKGDQNGNCGKEGGKFKPCAPENVLCGKLLCMEGSHYPLVGSTRVFYRNRFSSYVCKSLQSGNDTTGSDAVRDGTKCGDGKVCFNGVCANASSVIKPCQANCHGHGICNNFGNCHCDAGWAPPDCSKKGSGGSGDSGPICINQTDLQVILLAVFFAVIFPAVLGIIFFVWWRYCGGKQKVYAWRKNRAYRQGKEFPKKANEGKLSATSTGSAPPRTEMRPNNRRNEFSDIQTHEPPVSRSTHPPRPPPPVRPSPRLPVRGAPAPPQPARPKLPQKPAQNLKPPVAYHSQPKPPVVYHPQPATQNSSIQDRIAQLNRSNVA